MADCLPEILMKDSIELKLGDQIFVCEASVGHILVRSKLAYARCVRLNPIHMDLHDYIARSTTPDTFSFCVHVSRNEY